MTRPVILLLAVIAAVFATGIIVLILVPLKVVELGEPASTAAAVIAAWGLLGLVADIPGSALSDAIGRRSVIGAGCASIALAAVVLGLATDLGGIIAGLLLLGLGQALSFGPALAFLTEIAPPGQHARVQGWNGAIQAISSVAAALLAGLAIQLGFGPAFASVAVIGAVATIGVLFVPGEAARKGAAGLGRAITGSYGRALWMLMRRPPVGLAALLAVLYSIVFLIVATSFVPLVLVEIEGASALLAGALIAARNVTSALVSLTFRRVTLRFGTVTTVVRMSWLTVGGTALLGIVISSPVLVLVALIIQAVGSSYSAAAANVLVGSATSEDERAVGMSATTVTSRLTVLLVPLLISPFIAASTVGLAFGLAALAAAVVVILMGFTARSIDEGTLGRPSKQRA